MNSNGVLDQRIDDQGPDGCQSKARADFVYLIINGKACTHL